MYKKVALLVALFPMLAVASVKPVVMPASSPVVKSFVCQKYTDNQMTLTQGYLTDNPIVLLETKIEQTKEEFIVEKNDLFKEEIRMNIPDGGGVSGVSGNEHDMMFRRIDGNGKPFFIVYMANRDPQSDGEINRAVFIADCVRK